MKYWGNYHVLLNCLDHENAHEEDWKANVGKHPSFLRGEAGSYERELQNINDAKNGTFPTFYRENTKKAAERFLPQRKQ
jgi:hypothetical protein